jgi:peptidoglycan/xylan/chitin deacetylase (PgdA/CDA1 family)
VAALAFPDGALVAVAALLGNHAVLAAAGMWPRSTMLGPNLRRLPPAAAARWEVALTFDDGPDPDVTPRVLDLLDATGASASFFCIGRAARAQPALVREIVRRGHSVENHTDTHPNAFAAYGPTYLRREIGRAQAILADITGTPPTFFRAPMGLRSPLLEPVLAEAGLSLTSWTRRALDGTRGDPKAAERRLTSCLEPGDILLMHDGRCARTPDGRPCVLETLPRVLRTLAQRGLKTRALSDACAGDAPRKAAAS